MVRWFSRISEAPTRYWYVVCDSYDSGGLPGKMRTKVRRSYKDCTVRSVSAEWMAEQGYDCYTGAFGRYKLGRPMSRESFEATCRSCIGGPFSFFGAFIGEKLAAFAKCVVGEDYIAMISFRVDPQYNSSRPAYALLDTVLRTYVSEGRKPVGNGFQSLYHRSNMQDFLLQFGFRRVYCDLQLSYRGSLACAVKALYPFRNLIARLPLHPPIPAVASLLIQEEIRRSCAST
jgi:hypothetical protein